MPVRVRVSPSHQSKEIRYLGTRNQEKPFFPQFSDCVERRFFCFMASQKSLFLHKSGRWYYRQWIPLDLRSYFGDRQDIANSLKTTDHKHALILAAGFQQRYSTVFTLLRVGILSPDQIVALVQSAHQRAVTPRNIAVESPTLPSPTPPETSPCVSHTLSSIYALYATEHSLNWTDKSKMEFDGQFKLLLTIIGDKNANAVDRGMCITCRDALLNLSPFGRTF